MACSYTVTTNQTHAENDCLTLGTWLDYIFLSIWTVRCIFGVDVAGVKEFGEHFEVSRVIFFEANRMPARCLPRCTECGSE